MNKNILFAGVLALLSTSTALAQSAEKNKVLLGARTVNVSYSDTIVYVPVLTNQDLNITTSSDWVTPTLEHNSLKLQIQSNMDAEDRTATISVAAKNGAMTRTLTVEQEREGLAVYVPKEISVTASASQSGEGPERTLDEDTTTLWHSPYTGGSFPYTLTYDFQNVSEIDSLRYVPRSATSGTNGNFGQVEIYAKCEGDTDYKLVYSGDWEQKGDSRLVTFDEPLMNPKSVQFKIKSGAGGFASCAEMQFYRKNDNTVDHEREIFANDLWDSLKTGTTQSDIDALTNPYYKMVAQKLFDNRDEFIKGRIQEYTCRLSPYTQSDLLKAPGKYYDKLQGVTGININKGTHGIAVSGLPEGQSLKLKVVSWFSQELNDKGVGGGPVEYSYVLHNGINSIEYTSDYDGLAYIAYYSDESPVDHEKYPNVKVHFINASVNGYLSPDRTNEELDEVLTNAKNRCIDLVGDKVHSVWQVSGMQNYCKASDGTSKGYVQFMNALDTLVTWEQHLLGLQKYNRVPDNRTMAYVNYTYYMFQGDYGVSFMYDQESRVLNCKQIMYNDGDAIWGLSHEWGHQHQMQPYFCWAGLGESSNNMNSCENVLRMGYTGEYHAKRIKENWTNAYDHFFNNVDATYASESGDATYARVRAYENRSSFSWSSEVQKEIDAQYATYYKNGAWQIPSISSDPEHALSTNEVYVEENTAPFYMLHNFFSYTLPKEGDSSLSEFQLDLYESLRQNDEVNGSSVEKINGQAKTTVDKYELIASAQNGVEGKLDELKQKYPETCWLKYLNANSTWTQNSVPFIFNYIRKASLISGYNLFDYFDKFGFMRTIIMTIDDYGNKSYAMMKDMKDEFKEDMKALNLKEVSSEMMEKIAHSDLPVYETPEIPNEPVKK